MEPVRHTSLDARVPSTRLQYNRGKLFSSWCIGQSEDPVRCSVPTFLGFSAVPPSQGPISFYSESVYHVDTLELIIAQPQWVATVWCPSS